jgi:hypothetical protein
MPMAAGWPYVAGGCCVFELAETVLSMHACICMVCHFGASGGLMLHTVLALAGKVDRQHSAGQPPCMAIIAV